jgi:hypothetical protein
MNTFIHRTVVAVYLALLATVRTGQSPAALSGQVSSTEEGAMEGVVVSAKKDGATISVSVGTDAQGRFAFPAARLESGRYTLKARAAGYELDGAKAADVAAGGEAKADIRLKKVKNLSAHLTNAEWMMSIPGADEQKRFLLNCNGCHTLERIMKSSYDADGFLQIFERMANYYPGSTPLKPQRPRRHRGPRRSARRRRQEDRGMARQHQLEPAADVVVPAEDAAAAHRQVDAGDHHRIRPAESS